jgi:hypothetical protein
MAWPALRDGETLSSRQISVWTCSDRTSQPLRNRAAQASSKADLGPYQDDEGRDTEILKVRLAEIAH